MYNTIIPFKNLINGGIALIWVLIIYFKIEGIEINNFSSHFSNAKDLSIILVSSFVFLSYPLGIVITHYSYYIAKYILYPPLVFRKKAYNKEEHESRIEKLSVYPNEAFRRYSKEKTTELNIIGGSGLNFSIISILLFSFRSSICVGIFSFCFAVSFFIMTVEKYKSWYKTIKIFYVSTFEEKKKNISEKK